MYFGRFDTEESKKRSALPNEWTEDVTKVLTESYFEQAEKDNKFFDVYGEIYDKEFVVVISYLHMQDHLMSPISVFISHDNLEDSKNFKKTLAALIDLAGHIFDDIFATDQWSDYNSNWTENEYKNNIFFYKITRENISLSLQAEEFMKKEGNI